MMVRGKWLVAGLMMAMAPLAGCRDNPQAKADLKPLDDGLTWGERADAATAHAAVARACAHAAHAVRPAFHRVAK